MCFFRWNHQNSKFPAHSKVKNDNYFFSVFFFKLLPKLIDFINSDDCIGKIISKSIRLYPVFIQKRFGFNKKRDYFWWKKLEIQVILYMVMPTRSSERIFNPSRYTGNKMTMVSTVNVIIQLANYSSNGFNLIIAINQ